LSFFIRVKRPWFAAQVLHHSNTSNYSTWFIVFDEMDSCVHKLDKIPISPMIS
jgi:hypothetical protein